MIKLLLNSDKAKKESFSEEILVKKAIKGDIHCFEILIKKYKSYLYKIAFSYTKNEEDTLDLIQECSYKAWLNIKKLKKSSSFKFWISKILINIAINNYKNNNSTSPIENSNEASSIDDTLCIAEKLDLHNAIDLLKPEYKTVVILKYFDDMKIEDIASIMELPSNTVKTYLRRAKMCMKNILKEDYFSEE